jgi:hypothetical protein
MQINLYKFKANVKYGKQILYFVAWRERCMYLRKYQWENEKINYDTMKIVLSFLYSTRFLVNAALIEMLLFLL